MLRLLEALEDLDDVQNVYSNADIPADCWRDCRTGRTESNGEWTRILGIDPGSRITGYGLIDSDGADDPLRRERLHSHRG